MINIGIDVHKKRCIAALKLNNSRDVLERFTFENDTEGINRFVEHIKKEYQSQDVRAVCESTANYWIRLHDTLEENGINTILANPAKTKVIAQAKIKTDKIDSAILADLLRADMVYESFVPDKHYRDLRNLVRTRLGLIHNRTHIQNQIHSILAKYDHKPPTKKTFSERGTKWLQQISLSEIDRVAMDIHLQTITTIQNQIDKINTHIASISAQDERVRILMTIPGIDYLTALTMISEIVDSGRFATPEKLVAYAGLAPSQRSSGDTKRTGHITKQGSKWLRNAMVEAANTTIQHDTRIGDFYSRIAARRGPQKAKVAAAKEMLVISWHMLTKMEPYRTQSHSLTERKYKKLEKDSKLD